MEYFYLRKLTRLVVLSFLCSTIVLAGENPEIRYKRDFDPDQVNRDGRTPPFPPGPDLNRKSVNIKKSHEILRKALQEYLDFTDSDLGTYLNQMIQLSEPFVDEYGQVIHIYRKVFTFIYEQYNETLVQNYAVKHFDKDKLDMCSVARYLSHQNSVSDRKTIMKRMGDALEYRCHPCTPYKRKQYGETKVPDTSNINPDGVSPEESMKMCKDGFGLQETTTVSPVTTLPPPTTTTKIGKDYAELVKFDNYSPCKYSPDEIWWSRIIFEVFLKGSIVCDLATIEEVKEVFHRTTSTKITTVTLNIRYPDDKIPADVLSNKRTENLHLVSNDEEEHIELQVDSNAFRSTKNFTKSFLIYNFDGKNLELDFLSGFNKLRNLTFDTITNIHDCFPKLPPLPDLKILVMQYVSGLVDIQTFPHLVHGLNSVALAPHKEEEVWDNETVGSILEWLLISSAETLEFLSLEDNDYLTQVPTQISSFKALNYLRLVENNIHTIKTGALTFSSPVVTLRLFFNSFKVIQPGAFKGDFQDADIDIGGNLFTKVDENVFLPILQQMESGTGSIEVRNCEIDCSRKNICNLAWLIRDRRHLIGDKIFGECANETSFNELLPSAFSHCPNDL